MRISEWIALGCGLCGLLLLIAASVVSGAIGDLWHALASAEPWQQLAFLGVMLVFSAISCAGGYSIK